jgi:hypothetical protein
MRADDDDIQGLCFLIKDGNPARIPLIALFIFIFAGKSQYTLF